MRSSSTKFEVRFWFNADGLVEYFDVWVYELEPLECNKRPCSEWVQEAITNSYYGDDLREELEIGEGCYQVLARGELTGWYDDWTGEWDEEIEWKDVQSMKLPDDYFDSEDADGLSDV
jgi:hypothetical protein